MITATDLTIWASQELRDNYLVFDKILDISEDIEIFLSNGDMLILNNKKATLTFESNDPESINQRNLLLSGGLLLCHSEDESYIPEDERRRILDLIEPYSDDHCNCGLILISNEEFAQLSTKCNDANFQLCTHAIGDKGNRMVLDAYRNATKNSYNHRWRIEHAQMVTDEDIPKFLEYNILPSMQPSHCTSDMRWMDKRIGLDRLPRVSRWKSFLNLGIPIPGGSDCPIEDGNPMFEYYAAITRQDHNGWPENGWHNEETLDRMSALKMFTQWAAYGEFSENKRGTIESGFDADLTILNNDITQCEPSEILDTEVVSTIVGGEFIYSTL